MNKLVIYFMDKKTQINAWDITNLYASTMQNKRKSLFEFHEVYAMIPLHQSYN